MSGFFGDLSDKQTIALKTFKERVKDVWRNDFDDYMALRFLRAREFNVDKAEQMLRANLKWREANKVDVLLTDYQLPEVAKFAAGGLMAHDREGHPVYHMSIGETDFRSFMLILTPRDMVMYVVHILETLIADMKQQSEKLGKHIERAIFIFDFENFSVRTLYNRPVLDFLTSTLGVYEANYPERLQRAFVINAPKFFPILWKILRPFLSDTTASKVEIYGQDGWQEAIYKIIDRDEMPAYWGGTRVGANGCPKCSDLYPAGGLVDRKFIEEAKHAHLRNSATAKTIEIAKRSATYIEVKVNSVDSAIHWKFQTDTEHDIAFSLHYKNEEGSNGDDFEDIIESIRFNCYVRPEIGYHICDRSGLYLLKFDNTFSWFTNKLVHYEVDVKKIDDSNTLNISQFVNGS